MISDVLLDAVDQIDGYLNNETFADTYPHGEIREEILHMRYNMEKLALRIASPPKDYNVALQHVITSLIKDTLNSVYPILGREQRGCHCVFCDPKSNK